MTEQQPPSTGEQLEDDPSIKPLAIIQLELPAIATALVGLAKSGSVQACALCFKLGRAQLSPLDLFARALGNADQATLLEILDVLGDQAPQALLDLLQ